MSHRTWQMENVSTTPSTPLAFDTMCISKPSGRIGSTVAAEAPILKKNEGCRPLVALVPELDDYLRPAEARERFARVPQAEVVGVEGAKHLWVGEASVYRALSEIVQRTAPGANPLPTTWDGPHQSWNDLTGGLR